jgi:hypothetical protein
MHLFYSPLIIVLAVAFFLVEITMETYCMGIEAICLCYLQDKAINNGTRERPYYMTDQVYSLLSRYMRPIGAKSHDYLEKMRRRERRKAAYLSNDT